MSTWALRSAKRFAAEAERIELAHAGDWSSPHVEEHMDYVISSVLNSVVFIEAMINELYSDAQDNHNTQVGGYVAPLTQQTRDLMASWWAEAGERAPAVTKIQLLLSFAGLDKLDLGREPLASARLLIGLRNVLVHYKPETVYAGTPHELEAKLASRFAGNALVSGEGTAWWPHRALGAGCAIWSYRSAQALADEVSDRLRIRPNYKRSGI